MAQVRNLPGPERPGYLPRLGRGVLFPGVPGLGVIVTTLLTSLGSYGHHAVVIVALGEAVALAANIGMYFIAFRVLTPKAPRPASSCRRGRRRRGMDGAAGPWRLPRAPFPARRFGLRSLRHRARAPRPDLPGRRNHRLRRRDQRGTGAAAMAALHRPAAAHRSRPGRPGGSGTAEPAT